MRLIDADALVKKVCFRCKEGDGEGMCAEFCRFIAALDNTPTIDAVPVVHGQWVWFENCPVVDDEDPECISIIGYECSECGNNDSTCVRFYEEPSVYLLSCIKEGLKESLTNYCSNCGAKMDLEEPTNE